MVGTRRLSGLGGSRRNLPIDETRKKVIGRRLVGDDAESVDSPMTGEHHEEEELEEPRQQSRAINWTAALVIMVLMGAAAILGWLIYNLVSDNQEEEFKTAFEYNSQEIIKTATLSMNSRHTAFKTLSGLFPAFAEETNTTLPYISLSDFEGFGIGVREITNAKLVAFAPLIVNEYMHIRWNEYSDANQDWIIKGHMFNPSFQGNVEPIRPFIWHYDENDEAKTENGPNPYSPAWQMSPPPKDTSIINFNYQSNTDFANMVRDTLNPMQTYLSSPMNMSGLFGSATPPAGDHPNSLLIQPVSNSFNPSVAQVIGHILAVLPWSSFFDNLMQEGQKRIDVVVDSCGTAFTYEINGPKAAFRGMGDFHDKSYDKMVNIAPFFGQNNSGCEHTMYVYPSREMESSFESNDALLYTLVVVFIFVFSAGLFTVYYCMIRQRHADIVKKAFQSDKIVRNLFPGHVRGQLFLGGRNGKDDSQSKPKRSSVMSPATVTRAFDPEESKNSKPIADLFPEATILFADISGFTAWSSIREPSQVFTLLESLFQAFDEFARKHGVFKVETVGDCYVCVVGIPDYCKYHAVIMASFARDCAKKVPQVLRDLEMSLGPDTGDLAMRFGIHSGPVTAGVLRGDRARFQLFGDTVNTASRVESTGIRGRIHLSEQTANLLIAAGKGSWVSKREDQVEAKGKGKMTTYWLAPKESNTICSSEPSCQDSVVDNIREDVERPLDQPAQQKPRKRHNAKNRKNQRLIDWNSELLLQLLKPVVARRQAVSRPKVSQETLSAEAEKMGDGTLVVDEVAEIIHLPEFDPKVCDKVDVDSVEISPEVSIQLHQYVSRIASLYRDNTFHNFEHATHVTMSVNKLLSRIVAPKIDRKMSDIQQKEAFLHDHTYGITSDPLTQFSVVLAALIHDVDHRGIPNFLLIREDSLLASTYKSKSVAEQNSVDVAWKALMSGDFKDLRACIFGDHSELCRFRQLLVNSLIATDIFDKELGSLRKKRWDKAFAGSKLGEQQTHADINRKATIVIEHLIQASDVAHTMQHWHIYQQWNERLFREMYQTHLAGRWDKNPSDFWYQGELGFFDSYIIPLAKKLKDCGVFGVSSDEYLNYALENRREWEDKGQAIVEKWTIEHGPDF